MKPLLILLAVMAINVSGQSLSEKKDDSKEKAERIWEMAIKAKGGRERLHAIHNMLFTSGSKGVRNTIIRNGNIRKSRKKYDINLVSFFVFPDKSWSWIDQRPSIFGLRMTMYNFKTRKTYAVQAGDIQKGKWLEAIKPNLRSNNFIGLIGYFLETKWSQPKVERVFSAKVGKRNVDVIQTGGPNNRMDFMLDKETHFLLRTVAYSAEGIPNATKYSDYTRINGIMMPKKVTFEQEDGDVSYYRTYQINVEYNESIFEKPPLPVENAMDAWKKEWKP